MPSCSPVARNARFAVAFFVVLAPASVVWAELSAPAAAVEGAAPAAAPTDLPPAPADDAPTPDGARAPDGRTYDAAAAPPTPLSVLRADEAAGSPLERLASLGGACALVGLLWLMSENRRRIDVRLVAVGMALQVVMAVLLLKVPPVRAAVAGLNDAFVALTGYADRGGSFVFGRLTAPAQSIALPAGGAVTVEFGAIVAFRVLPILIFFSALMGILYHLGVMQRIVGLMAKAMQRTLKTSGAETLSAAANVFVGMTEAPLTIRPYLAAMTRSELLCVMVGGFATVAGTVMAAYIAMLAPFMPEIGVHLMTASLLSAPAALVCAKILVPETETPVTAGATPEVHIPTDARNVLDAAARGTADGLALALNVAAMLIAFVSLVAAFDGLLGAVGGFVGVPGLSLELIGGYVFAPFAVALGIPPAEALAAGRLLSLKTVVNEFVAYLALARELGADAPALSPRSAVILSYAMCGFANIGSIGILLGGLGALVPTRRTDLADLGWKALVGGTVAAFLTGTVAGVVL